MKPSKCQKALDVREDQMLVLFKVLPPLCRLVLWILEDSSRYRSREVLELQEEVARFLKGKA